MIEQTICSVLFCILAIGLALALLFAGIQITQPLTLLLAWRTMMYAQDIWIKSNK